MDNVISFYVGVRFGTSTKAYYFSTEMGDLKIGDLVVTETVAGVEIGTVCTAPIGLNNYGSSLALKPIIRKPTQEDLGNYEYNNEESKRALDITEEEVRRLGLPMNLLEATYTLDGSKVTITYTSDNRVDFRELLRVLAPQLQCRIELRQIASRDKAKMVGGIAICGLPLCCSTFLTQFDGISISRAKNQMLTLNIPKLSGPCGKLICCLLYEDDLYTEAKKNYPHIGSPIKLMEGEYTVSGFNILSRTVKVTNPLDTKLISLDDYNAAATKMAKSYSSKKSEPSPNHA